MKTVRLLFSDAMARAIVDGRKTVTRRPVTDASSGSPPTGAQFYMYHQSVPAACFTVPGHMPGTHWCARMPCVQGDLLIGRECWAQSVPGCEFQGGFAYRADHVDKRGDGPANPMKWRPSIHMPDWAARIRRRVVGVQVERLQSITEADAEREGFDKTPGPPPWDGQYARSNFADTWDAIYAGRGLAWHLNPWVWRIEFSAENVT